MSIVSKAASVVAESEEQILFLVQVREEIVLGLNKVGQCNGFDISINERVRVELSHEIFSPDMVVSIRGSSGDTVVAVRSRSEDNSRQVLKLYLVVY